MFALESQSKNNMTKTISISVHVDGYYGFKIGISNMLRLFKKYNIGASFFVNLGREANIIDLLKYRNKNRINERDKRVVSRYTKLQLACMCLLNRKIGSGNISLLRRIKSFGHEVNPHAWSHLKWSKDFSNFNYKKEIGLMNKIHKRAFGTNPEGFSPPDWKYDSRILKELKNLGFKYLGINGPGDKIKKVEGISLIPLSFDKNLEELEGEGLTSEQILQIYKKEISKNYVNLYFHADYEGIRGLRMFEKILQLIDSKKVKTYGELIK